VCVCACGDGIYVWVWVVVELMGLPTDTLMSVLLSSHRPSLPETRGEGECKWLKQIHPAVTGCDKHDA
jgi:hypothetical protein